MSERGRAMALGTNVEVYNGVSYLSNGHMGGIYRGSSKLAVGRCILPNSVLPTSGGRQCRIG